MAAEIISCPECQRKLRVTEGLQGRLVKCPSCATTFTAEADSSAPSQVPMEEHPPWEQSDEQPLARSEDSGRAREDDYDDEGRDDRAPRGSRRRRRRRHQAPHRGNLILTLGIVSLFVFHLPLGPIAWVMGNADMAEIQAGRMDREGESSTNTGRICGMISTILSIVGLGLAFVIIFCFFCGCAGLAGVGGAGGGGRPPMR